jgi:deoxyadenosine/deoxycytidine kinase
MILKKICIDSNIAGGKTTQLNLLEKELKKTDYLYKIYKEEVSKWQEEGWLNKFYEDMKKNSFGFQMRVLLSQIEQGNSFYHNDGITQLYDIIISERSPLTNRHVFGEILLDDGDLQPIEYELFNKYYEKFAWFPDIIIYIHVSPSICFERVMKRNRGSEKLIPLEYLEKLDKKYEELLKNQKNVYRIDGTMSIEEINKQIMNIIINVLNGKL